MAFMSKGEQAEKYLRDAIARGKWKPGESLPAERELLLELGISRTTLRDALNLLAGDGVLIRKSRLGTFVADKVGTSVIAILAESDDLTSPFSHWFKLLAEGSRKAIEDAGYRSMLMVGQGESAEAFLSSIALLEKSLARDTVGVLSLTHTAQIEKYLDGAGIHSVTIGPSEVAGQYCVEPDMEQLLRLGIEALRSHGHQDFVLMDVDRTGMPLYEMSKKAEESRDRIRRSATQSRDDRIILVPWSPNHEHVYGAFKDWWARDDRPSAIFFLDDMLCDISTSAILELGIRVPADLAIITLANAGRTFHFPVPITSVGFDAEEAVSLAMNMLQLLINDQQVPEAILGLQPALVERASL